MRKANAYISLALLALLVFHIGYNTVYLGRAFNNDLLARSASLAAWAAVVIVAAHVVSSGITSVQMLRDTGRPPSQRKKQHLLLKWLTGIALCIIAGLHIANARGLFVFEKGVIVWGILICAVGCLGAHVYTGARSLLKDMGLPTQWKGAVRTGTIICAGLIGISLLVLAARSSIIH